MISTQQVFNQCQQQLPMNNVTFLHSSTKPRDFYYFIYYAYLFLNLSCFFCKPNLRPKERGQWKSGKHKMIRQNGDKKILSEQFLANHVVVGLIERMKNKTVKRDSRIYRTDSPAFIKPLHLGLLQCQVCYGEKLLLKNEHIIQLKLI